MKIKKGETLTAKEFILSSELLDLLAHHDICDAFALKMIRSNLIALILLSNNAFSPTKPGARGEKDVCNSTVCRKAAQAIIDTMDSRVDPCEDFYEFACGKFVETRRIPK